MNTTMQQTKVIYFYIRPWGFYQSQARVEQGYTANVDDYLREYWAKQGTTFACEKRSDGNWYIAYAQCGSKDQFSRRLGRMVSTGRLRCRRKPDLAVLFGKEEPSFDDCVTILNLIEYNDKY